MKNLQTRPTSSPYSSARSHTSSIFHSSSPVLGKTPKRERNKNSSIKAVFGWRESMEKGKKERKSWNLVAEFDSVHDVEAENASENSAGHNPNVTPFLRSRHFLWLLFRRILFRRYKQGNELNLTRSLSLDFTTWRNGNLWNHQVLKIDSNWN